jgi:hypothetical protein
MEAEKRKWKSIFESKDSYRAEIIHKLLLSNDINATILNKEDRSYVGIGLGRLSVMVNEVDMCKALSLIKTDLNE